MYYDNNVYNSGLSEEDWKILRDVLLPFIHAKEPSKLTLPEVPLHLKEHPLIRYLQMYIATGDEKYLDLAGQCLIPSQKPFGWYLPLTK